MHSWKRYAVDIIGSSQTVGQFSSRGCALPSFRILGSEWKLSWRSLRLKYWKYDIWPRKIVLMWNLPWFKEISREREIPSRSIETIQQGTKFSKFVMMSMDGATEQLNVLHRLICTKWPTVRFSPVTPHRCVASARVYESLANICILVPNVTID